MKQSDKTKDCRFRVNAFNNQYREVWKYTKYISEAMRIRRLAEMAGLSSVIQERIKGTDDEWKTRSTQQNSKPQEQ